MNVALVQGEEFGCSTVHITRETPSGSTLPVPHKAAELDPSLAAQKKKAQNVRERRENFVHVSTGIGTIITKPPKCQPGLWCAVGSLSASPAEESTRAALDWDPATEEEFQNREAPGELHVGPWLPPLSFPLAASTPTLTLNVSASVRHLFFHPLWAFIINQRVASPKQGLFLAFQLLS